MRQLQDWINAYIDYNQDAECPTTYLKWAAVSTIAAALQRKVWSDWGTEIIYPNFYILLVGPPGRTRKASAMKPARKLVNELGFPMAPDATTIASLTQTLEASQSSYINNFGFPVVHSSLTVFSPEFFVFLNKKEAQFIEVLTDWYDCAEGWNKTTKTAGDNIIPGIYFNVLGGTTPSQVQESLPSNAIGVGLTSRMIFVCENNARKRVPMPFFPKSDEGKALFKSLTNDLQEIYQLKGSFSLSKNFLARYVDWYENMPSTPTFKGGYRFEGYWSRRATHLKKLVMIMAASRKDVLAKVNDGVKHVIKECDFIRALEFLEEIEPNMPKTFGEAGRDKTADILTPIMTELMRCERMSFNQLLRTFIRDTNVEELNRIVMTLQKAGYIRITTQANDRILEVINECSC